MTDVDHQKIANRFAAGLSRGDLGVIDEIYAEDAVEEFPQSGEVFRGRASIRGVLERAASEFASGERGPDLSTVEGHGSDEHRVLAPLFTVVHVQGRGDAGTITLKSRYPDGSWWWIVVVYETSGGRIVHSSKFFGPEFEPAPFRAPFVELAEPES